MQLCGWRTSVFSFSSCRPRRELLGLIFLLFKMWPGLIELWEGILFWGSINRLCCSSMLSCFSKLLENGDLMDRSPALQGDRGWRLCSEGLSSTLGSRAFSVLTAPPLPPLQSLVLKSGGCGRQRKVKNFHVCSYCFLGHKHTALSWSKKSGDERGSRASSCGEGCIFPFY